MCRSSGLASDRLKFEVGLKVGIQHLLVTESGC